MNLLNTKLILKREDRDEVKIEFIKEYLSTEIIESINYNKKDKYYNEKEKSFNDFIRVNKYKVSESGNVKIYIK